MCVGSARSCASSASTPTRRPRGRPPPAGRSSPRRPTRRTAGGKAGSPTRTATYGPSDRRSQSHSRRSVAELDAGAEADAVRVDGLAHGLARVETLDVAVHRGVVGEDLAHEQAARSQPQPGAAPRLPAPAAEVRVVIGVVDVVVAAQEQQLVAAAQAEV